MPGGHGSRCCLTRYPKKNRALAYVLSVIDAGVEIVDIQTDNVEKWSSSPRLVEERSLSERCYNKEDYKSPCARSGLEYRLNVYRVYYRPTALTEADASSPVKPVEPCCCFVGCCVM